MATVDDLVRTLAEALGLQVGDVAWLAGKLMREQLLPVDDGEPVEPLGAARLLVAVMGSRRPLDATDVVTAYDTLPARTFVISESDGAGGQFARAVPIEDVPLQPGEGPGSVLLTRSFTGALAACIECFMAANSQQAAVLCPETVAVLRNPDAPLGVIQLGPVPSAPGVGRVLAYSRDEGDEYYVLARRGMSVWAHAQGSVLRRLGECLADDRAASSGLPPAVAVAAREA